MIPKVSFAENNNQYSQQFSCASFINFRGDDLNSLESSPNKDVLDTKKKKNTGAKIAIGSVLVAGLLVGGDYLFAKGRHVKDIIKKYKFKLKMAEAKRENNPNVPKLKDIGVTFKKGEAFDKDGKPFSGKFVTENNKEKRKIIHEYKDGKLTSSKTYQRTVRNKEGEFIAEQEYSYNSEGKISEITQGNVCDVFYQGGKVKTELLKKTIKYQYNPDGKIKSIVKSEKLLDKAHEMHFEYNKDGKLVKIKYKILKLGKDGKSFEEVTATKDII